jgi:hypothetical protein
LADLFHAIKLEDESMEQLRQSAMIYAEIGTDKGVFEPEIWKLMEW